MKFTVDPGLIPGTIKNKVEMGDVTGMEFLNKIFYISNGIMLTQIREVSGVDGSTLQNWVKRGWVANTVNKKYNKDQLARIIIINMLRDCMLLERVDALLHYINGALDDTSDDIIPESKLFDYICTIYDTFSKNGCETDEQLRELIVATTSDYVEPVDGAKERLNSALEIILIAYFCSTAGKFANALFEKLMPEV